MSYLDMSLYHFYQLSADVEICWSQQNSIVLHIGAPVIQFTNNNMSGAKADVSDNAFSNLPLLSAMYDAMYDTSCQTQKPRLSPLLCNMDRIYRNFFVQVKYIS